MVYKLLPNELAHDTERPKKRVLSVKERNGRNEEYTINLSFK